MAHQKISQAIDIVKNYALIEGISSEEKASLDTLRIVFEKYHLALLKAKSMFENGRLPNEVDSLVKIEDAPALEAFVTLERVYDELTSNTTQKISESISRSLNTLI